METKRITDSLSSREDMNPSSDDCDGQTAPFSFQQRQAKIEDRQLSPQQATDSTGESQTPSKSLTVVPNNRRPFKKRLRLQFQGENSPPRAAIPRQPEALLEDQPLPTRKTSTFSRSSVNSTGRNIDNQNNFEDADESLTWSDSDSNVMSTTTNGRGTTAEDASFSRAVVTPPRLERQVATFYPLVDDQQTSRHLTAREKPETGRIVPLPSPSFPPVSSLLDEDWQNPFERNKKQKPIDDSEQQFRRMYAAVYCKLGLSVTEDSMPLPPLPPQLAPSESESMCIMMKDLFDPSSPSNSMDSVVVENATCRPSATGTKTRRSIFSSPSRMQYHSDEDHEMVDAVSTMQHPMITTPKKLYRFKGNSSSSFASSASGSSRSSCVTPSPSKRMMASKSIKIQDEASRPLGRSLARSMGNLDDGSGKSCGSLAHTSGSKGSEKPPPTFPELADPIKAIRMVEKNRLLTEEEKIAKVTKFLVIPPRRKAKLPPRHVGRTLSGSKNYREKGNKRSEGRLGSGRPFIDEMKETISPANNVASVARATAGSSTPHCSDATQCDRIFQTAAVSPDAVGGNAMWQPPSLQQQQQVYGAQSGMMSNGGNVVFRRQGQMPLGEHCFAALHAQGVDPNVFWNGCVGLNGRIPAEVAMSWTQRQKLMFNPYKIPVAAATTMDGKQTNKNQRSKSQDASQTAPRRISQI